MNNITRLNKKNESPLIHGRFRDEHFIAGIAPETDIKFERMIITWEWSTARGYYFATWYLFSKQYGIKCDGVYEKTTPVDHMMCEVREAAFCAEIIARAGEFPDFAKFIAG